MSSWGELTRELERTLRLRTFPVAYKRLEKAEDLAQVPKVRRMARFFTFCQLPALVRTRGWTVGATIEDDINERCARIHGLAAPTQKSMAQEAAELSTTWYPSVAEASRQLAEYPRIPPGAAIVLAPLAAEKFDPDVVLIYGNPVQAMFILNGLQRKKHERFQFFFIGEGACADSLAQCYVSGKPALTIPCFGERRFGEVLDEELVLALPAEAVGRALEGMRELATVGLRYPIPVWSAECDPLPTLARASPALAERRKPKSTKPR